VNSNIKCPPRFAPSNYPSAPSIFKLRAPSTSYTSPSYTAAKSVLPHPPLAHRFKLLPSVQYLRTFVPTGHILDPDASFVEGLDLIEGLSNLPYIAQGYPIGVPAGCSFQQGYKDGSTFFVLVRDLMALTRYSRARRTMHLRKGWCTLKSDRVL